MFKRVLGFAIAGLAFPSSSFGQDWFGPVMQQPTYMGMVDTMNTNIMTDAIGRAAEEETSHRERRPATTQAAHRTSYSFSSSLSRSVASEFTRRLRAKNPAAAAEVEGQMRQHDFGRVYSNIVAPYGLRRGDAADALTAYTLLGWMVANGQADPSRDRVDAARREVAAILATNPALADEAARAKLGEELTILFVLLHAGWQSAQKEGKLQAYSDGVAATFRKQFGRDLRRLELTTTGFVERG